MKPHLPRLPWFRLAVLLAVAAVAAVLLVSLRVPDVWLTPDQRGDRLMRQGHFDEAAQTYQDPYRQGVALYRAGKLKEAAAAFDRSGGPGAAFDRGNALVLLGKYDDAIKSYDRALALRPDWPEAEDNRAVARVRRDRLRFQGGDASEGEVKPDKLVFDKPDHKEQPPPEEAAAGKPMSDEDLRGLWLRRVQTRPEEFLRNKFAYQYQEQQRKEAKGP